MDLQIGVALRVGVDDGVDEIGVGGFFRPAPGCAGALAGTSVFTAWNILRGSFAIAFPVPHAAHVDQAFDLEIREVEDGADEGVVVVKLGIGGDDDSRFWGSISLLRGGE